MSWWASFYGLSPEQLEAAQQNVVPDTGPGFDPRNLGMPNCNACHTTDQCSWCREPRCPNCKWPLDNHDWCSFCDAFDWTLMMYALDRLRTADWLLGTR